MSPQQKLDLLSRAKDHWLEAESTSYAYERALKSAKNRSEWLKMGTIFAALLTTGCGFANFTWLTVASGLLTTGLAAAERLYSPTENYQKYWGCRTKLLEVKGELVMFSITFNPLDDIEKGAQPLTEFAQRIVAIIQETPVMPSDEDARKAQESFRLVTIARIIARAEREAGVIEPITEAREILISKVSSPDPEVKGPAVKTLATIVGQFYPVKDLVEKSPEALLLMLQAKIEEAGENKDPALRKKLTRALITTGVEPSLGVESS